MDENAVKTLARCGWPDNDDLCRRRNRIDQHIPLEEGRLSEHRLRRESPTRRMLAACCNTPILLDFTKGHWLSFYRGCLPEQVPPLEMRVMVKDKPAAVMPPNDLPIYPSHSGKFMWKLLSSCPLGLRWAFVVRGYRGDPRR